MNRFLAQPMSAVVISDLLRCTTGVLGCTALAGVISISAAAPVEAVAPAAPEPHKSRPLICRHTPVFSDRHSEHRCKNPWLGMNENSRRRSGRGREFTRRCDRFDWKLKVEREFP